MSNFEFLDEYWKDLAKIGKMAEEYLHMDANACIYKIGLLAERIVMEICDFESVDLPAEAGNADRIRFLKNIGVIPKNIDDILFLIRKTRNNAVHNGENSYEKAKVLLRMAFNLCNWFMEVYGNWKYTAKEYIEPTNSLEQSDFNARMKAQEEKLNELMLAVENIKTGVSESLVEERISRAQTVSENIKLTDAESVYINSETVRLDVKSVPVINYALYNNGISFIQGIGINNMSDEALKDVVLNISSKSDLLYPFSMKIEYIPENKNIDIKSISIKLNPEILVRATEKFKDCIIIKLLKDDNTIIEECVDVTVLAFDEWHGISYFPELLSSFVVPNNPCLNKILRNASTVLEKWTGDPSMDAYQSQDSNRVLMQAAAVYVAIQKEEIVYSVPPASFETTGQRIRLCDNVLREKFGTCLDLTLLYVSCLEAVGLHPIIIIEKGHAYSGLWLEDLSFPETIQYDPSVISKRLADGISQIAILETTCLVRGKAMSFDNAKETAEMSFKKANDIECIIDVHRSRMSGISPLPQRIYNEGNWYVETEKNNPSGSPDVPKGIKGLSAFDMKSDGKNVPKITQWERKLLDLGLRNNLINLRFSKTLIPLLSNSLDVLEDALSEGGNFSILSRPSDIRVDDSDLTFDKMHTIGQGLEVLKTEFANKRLHSILSEGELTKIIKNLYRNAKTAMEENGANTLYLALGILRWYETERSTKPRYAPIVLLPIEIIRKSANKGYEIRLREDEPQINITILEKMKQDFGIVVDNLDPLPEDEHGIDLRKVFTILRKAVMEQKHWDVLESAYLGAFSFSQFVMWNDMRNRTEDLLKNKVVKSLVDGKLSWSAKSMNIGKKVPEDNVLLTMPADASQLYAIESACNGESFVLHGPPGTGKSQTITSLIANALAQGKSVLFVAEKMAALEVVQKRLENIGIGAFCMELHSNKSKKGNVLEQLRKAFEVTKYQSAEQYRQKAQQISNLRRELDSYATELHTVQECGYTFHELINEYEIYKNAVEIPRLPTTYTDVLSSNMIEDHTILLERLVAAAREISHPKDHPLSDIGLLEYSQNVRIDTSEKIQHFKSILEELDVFEEFGKKVKVSNINSFKTIEKIYNIASEVKLWQDIPEIWARSDSMNNILSETEKMIDYCKNVEKAETLLMNRWNEMFLEQNGRELLAEYGEISAKWFLPRAFAMNKFIKKIKMFARGEIEKSKLADDIYELIKYQDDLKSTKSLLDKHSLALGDMYAEKKTDWDKVSKCISTAKTSNENLIKLTGGIAIRRNLSKDTSIYTLVDAVLEKYPKLVEAKDECYSLLEIKEKSISENWISYQIDMCNNILNNIEQIKEWISFNNIAKIVDDAGFGNLVEVYKKGMKHEEVIPAYKKAVFHALCINTIDKSKSMNSFSGAVFNEKIQQYKRIDTELISLSQQEVYCRLAGKVPDFVETTAHSSELGILQRMIKSNGRGMSIRRLFESIPNLLPRLCPCMLMSPISAAQYLDPKREMFDIVVFDEASQLPTYKAAGVLARGKNAVIVGDPKQMPPTTFFATNTVDEDNLDIEDMESILDDCLAINMPQTHLLWHYRSRHESLIAFSNKQFYENKLYTFPSVNDRESKVSLVYVDGVFERGKSRTNKAEANAVVAEIKRRCHSHECSKYSVGVVTFNIAQQHLIDDLLAEECGNDAELEKWLYEAEEPIFIKNLENVQGDERDVILFSIGYGPDENGKVYMNFGPLNREGGWRRLNVAVSRARSEMIVFSTLKPDQINLSKTNSEGVIALKSFLEYASGKELAVGENDSGQRYFEKVGIANSICEALKQKGYKTDIFVGNSEYRIDVAVVDSKNPEKYILGILLDGFCYGSAQTTRDREIAQIDVLNGLNWNIIRVWSMDWWDNSTKEINRIVTKIENLKKGLREKQQEDFLKPKKKAKYEPEVEKKLEPVVVKSKYEVIPYKIPKISNPQVSAEDFVSGNYRIRIEHTLRDISQVEAPISEDLLIKRAVQSFGINRMGSRIQKYVERVLCSNSFVSNSLGEEKIYWNYPDDYKSFNKIRFSDDENKRDVKDVPIAEAVNAICYVLEQQISLSEEDLIREAAKVMGYTKLGSIVSSVFLTAIVEASKQRKIKKSLNDNWVLAV